MTAHQTIRYKLHNQVTGKDLKHPKFGIWVTNNLSEANEMKDACHEYLRAIGLDELISKIILKQD